MSEGNTKKKHHKAKKVDSTYTKIFKLYDEDNDGYVDFAYLSEAFKFWDTDNSGRVATEDIRRALTTLGDKLSESEINALIREADPSNVGAIDYEHYSKLLFRKIN